MKRPSTLLLIAAAARVASCSAAVSAAIASRKSTCFAVPQSLATGGITCSRMGQRHVGAPSVSVGQRPTHRTDERIAPMFPASIISSQLAAASNNGDMNEDTSFDIDGRNEQKRRSGGIRRFVPSLLFKPLSSVLRKNDNAGDDSKRLSRQRMKKAATASLAFLYLATFRLRPAWGTTWHDTDATYVNRPVSAVAASINNGATYSDAADNDAVIRKVVQCKAAVSLRPGVTLEEAESAESGTVASEGADGRAVIDDFDLGDTTTTGDAAAPSAAGSTKKLSRRERRALKKKQRQQQRKWEEYGDDDEDDDMDEADYADDGMTDFGLGAGAAAAAGVGTSGMGSGPAGGRMTAPAGAASISDKAKSNIQAKVIVIAGGGYVLSCVGYEGFQWNKEQKKVETSIEILTEQAKELGLVGMNETNATATDEEIADELSKLGNTTGTTEGDGDGGSEDDDDDSDDEDDEDDDEPEPPTRSRRPRKPIRPSDDDDDDDYGGSGGAGDGRPSADDLDRLNRMFKK
mmetsp:Transcript_5822/g.12680  ORF Transcript_5822/g.12680 Transcript_5822/m.12680 type:complete len:518 (-) Transcript_5822:182-1735(-)